MSGTLPPKPAPNCKHLPPANGWVSGTKCLQCIYDDARPVDNVRLVRGYAIPGVEVRPLRRIPDERGTVMHCFVPSEGDTIGEVYVSTIYAGAVKGWHRHANATLRYACLAGRVKCVLATDAGDVMEVFLGPDSYSLLIVPPGVWNGFKGMTDAMVMNVCAVAHGDMVSERRDPHYSSINYDWARRDE